VDARTAKASTEALESLRRLLDNGDLATRYPELPGLLSLLSDDDVVPAGMLLSRIDPEPVRRLHPGTPVTTVAVTGHGMVAGLLAPLAAELTRHGILPRLHAFAYNSYFAQLGDPGSALHATAPDVVLCLLDGLEVFTEIPMPC
jgi:hypothetical protein